MVQNAALACFEDTSCHCYFHPKNILDKLCIQDKHFFLPLPPYSPDLNPIEQAWAILKKVTDLLREVPNIFECLERFLKLNDNNTRDLMIFLDDRRLNDHHFRAYIYSVLNIE